MGKQRKKIQVECDRYSPNTFDWEPVARELYDAGKVSVTALTMPYHNAAERHARRNAERLATTSGKGNDA